MKPTRPNDDTGRWGEREAERFLRRAGYRILGRRVRPSARDEIDLVARDAKTLVFIEVKTRASDWAGRPAAAVDRRKRAVLSRAAVRYIQRLKQRDVFFRFDIVEVIGSPAGGEAAIRHIENAFPLDARYALP